MFPQVNVQVTLSTGVLVAVYMWQRWACLSLTAHLAPSHFAEC